MIVLRHLREPRTDAKVVSVAFVPLTCGMEKKYVNLKLAFLISNVYVSFTFYS